MRRLLVVLALASCQPADQTEATRPAESAAVSDSVVSDSPATAETATHGHGPADTSTLEPKPLLPIMQQLGVDMMALTHALFTDDYTTVMQRAAAVANHAPISAADLKRIEATLGGDMAAFEKRDAATHSASVKRHEAAASRDADAILQQLAEVQASCVTCHTQFRERLKTNK